MDNSKWRETLCEGVSQTVESRGSAATVVADSDPHTEFPATSLEKFENTRIVGPYEANIPAQEPKAIKNPRFLGAQ